MHGSSASQNTCAIILESSFSCHSQPFVVLFCVLSELLQQTPSFSNGSSFYPPWVVESGEGHVAAAKDRRRGHAWLSSGLILDVISKKRKWDLKIRKGQQHLNFTLTRCQSVFPYISSISVSSPSFMLCSYSLFTLASNGLCGSGSGVRWVSQRGVKKEWFGLTAVPGGAHLTASHPKTVPSADTPAKKALFINVEVQLHLWAFNQQP